MLSVISPAKSMNFEEKIDLPQQSEPHKWSETEVILANLKSLSVEDIIKIMKVSRKIAQLNYDRFRDFADLPQKPALFAYNGDVYNNIDTNNLDDYSLKFAQKHLRIISAFYGLLRPLDAIKAYRLEMSTKLPDLAPKGMNLFWQEIITEEVNKLLADHKNKFLINIASNEYRAAINEKKLSADLINLHFRKKQDGELKNIPIRAKHARGMMADFIIRNQIDHPDDLKKFNYQDYLFDNNLSDSQNFYYISDR